MELREREGRRLAGVPLSVSGPLCDVHGGQPVRQSTCGVNAAKTMMKETRKPWEGNQPTETEEKSEDEDVWDTPHGKWIRATSRNL